MKDFFSIALLFLFVGCSDNATIIKVSNDLGDVKCMHLVVFPPNDFLSTTMKELYKFDDNCRYRLDVSQKSGIVCNSNQNADKKVLANFPSGYIRLDLYKGDKVIYSYYKDLTHKTTKDDLLKAFSSLEKELP